MVSLPCLEYLEICACPFIEIECPCLEELVITRSTKVYQEIGVLSISSKKLRVLSTSVFIKALSIKGPCLLEDASFLLSVGHVIHFECPLVRKAILMNSLLFLSGNLLGNIVSLTVEDTTCSQTLKLLASLPCNSIRSMTLWMCRELPCIPSFKKSFPNLDRLVIRDCTFDLLIQIHELCRHSKSIREIEFIQCSLSSEFLSKIKRRHDHHPLSKLG